MTTPTAVYDPRAFAFFLEHAGYSYDPKTQTPDEGRYDCARALAIAEAEGCALGLEFRWEVDSESTSAEWSDDPDPWEQWECWCVWDGDVAASLHGIDFGRGGEPWGDPYRRVVEAELALQALADSRPVPATCPRG